MANQHAIISDEEVLAGSRTRPDLFEVLVDRYQSAFLRKATSILRDEALAADAVQETFVRIYLAAEKFKPVPGASFSSWAYRILVNQCYTLYNKHKKDSLRTVEFSEALEAITPDSHNEDWQKNKLDADEALSFVSRLPIMFQRIITLAFLEDKSPTEIAAIEGITENLVRVRIHRAKKMLQQIYTGSYTY